MVDTLDLTLTEPAHTALADKANGRGDNATVDRRALFALLRDHSAALAKLNDMGVKTR